jgi:hypothetical protein
MSAPDYLSIISGLAILGIVTKKRGFNKYGLEHHWALLTMVGAALVLFPIAAFLDRTYFPTK